MTGMRITIPIPEDSDEELSKCLEPCPFCGSKRVEILQDKDNHNGRPLWLIRHWDDGCILFGNTIRYSSRTDLVEDWNRRVEK